MEELGRRLEAVLSDRYTIERELGRGGMATVFLAQDLKHNRHVAIKVLRPEIAAAIGADRFLREIETAAQLTHPHILPLFDSGEADGLLYYVMPHFEGESLRDRLDREKQLPLEDAIQITKHVAAALAHAHSLGIVHRDIKPGNIMLEGGEAVVADFGIARAITSAGGEHLTDTGITLGTPAYMSPEQAGGEEHIDGRSDLYALGCVLYEMLGGEPPFTGPSSQAIIARQMQEEPRSLRVVRPKVPPAIEAVVHTALEKVPADRFNTATQMIEALDHPERMRAASPLASARRRRWFLLAPVGVLTLIAALAVWRLALPPTADADPNRIMVFPMLERGLVEGGAGYDAAIMIGNALNHTEPLKFEDGWIWLDEEQRGDAALLSAELARTLSLAQGARYYITGSILATSDSATVTLQLHDAVADTTVGRESTGGGSAQASILRAGIQTIVRLLPKLLEPGRDIDPAILEAITAPDPAAIAHWIQGERHYRLSHYEPALEHYRNAVKADSSWAFAALKGAQAASWAQQLDEAQDLVGLALENSDVLPSKYAHFARGLRDYLAGSADSAVANFKRALAADSAWGEAWMALGEAYYHLMPQARRLDSLAEAAFRTARRVDHRFFLPLFHLTEITLRRGQVEEAEQFIGEFRRTEPDTTLLIQLSLMADCVREGPDQVDWAGASSTNPEEVFEAARALSAGGYQADCAVAGFNAVLKADEADANHQWGALFGLQNLLIAGGKTEEARAELEAAVEKGVSAAMLLYIVDASAGFGMDEKAAVVVELFGRDYASMSSIRLWYLGVWHAHLEDVETLETITMALEHNATTSEEPRDRLISDAMRARLFLARGDTAQTIVELQGLHPFGTRAEIGGDFWTPLSAERMMLTELLFRRGRYADAYEIARTFDYPQAMMDRLYVGLSLEIRSRIGEALQQPRLVDESRQRLVSLGINEPTPSRM